MVLEKVKISKAEKVREELQDRFDKISNKK